MAIEWSPSLSVDVPDIDRQHRALFDTIARLLDRAGQGRGREEVAGVLRFLGAYVEEHFGLEEGLMREHHYPSYVAHKAEHDAFVADFRTLEQEFAQTGATTALVLQVNDRVSSWLWRHIARSDRTLGLYLASRLRPRPALPVAGPAGR